MDMFEKIAENMAKIIKVTGFYIVFPGDPSVGIFESQWKLEGDFYFDNQDELEEFRALLNLTYRNYVGDDCKIITFEEHQALVDSGK